MLAVDNSEIFMKQLWLGSSFNNFANQKSRALLNTKYCIVFSQK